TLSYLAFFFQAEDGIRDFHVTGVQTCALPIYSRTTRKRSSSQPGSAMMLIATWMPSERANSSASKFWSSVTRLRKVFSPSSSIRSEERRVGKERGYRRVAHA